MSKISFANRIASHFPFLKKDLRIAHLSYSPAEYVDKSMKMAVIYAALFTILFFFILQKAKISYALLAPIFLALLALLFWYSLIGIKAHIKKRQSEIDKEVLFIGRYLLIKLYSGRPLLNALIETSNSRGIASRYIKEIVDDISTGSTIENALSNAMTYSPSPKLARILFHLNNALQLGIDVTRPLESVIEEITKEEELEVDKYGKKLNTLVIFYMLFAVIMPSLGVTIFIVISSFINFPIQFKSLLILVFFIAVLEWVFIAVFKSIRPMVNL